jgi:hypothetical protein
MTHRIVLVRDFPTGAYMLACTCGWQAIVTPQRNAAIVLDYGQAGEHKHALRPDDEPVRDVWADAIDQIDGLETL